MVTIQNAEEPINTLCMACVETDDNNMMIDFKPKMFQRRALKEGDVLIDMKYCGVCHTDQAHCRSEFPPFQTTKFPAVPGHELAGVCVAVGPNVTKVKVGDHVGVGCMVDSCLNCKACLRGEEQMCIKQVFTYGAKDLSGRAETYPKGGVTIGGYTQKMVVHERFAIIIPPEYPLEYAGPVMCAGVTMYDPMKRQGAKAGTRLGIVGLGGLGMTGVKIGSLLGCTVTAVSRANANAPKSKAAIDAGATNILCSKDDSAMAAAAGTFDLIINTIPIPHDYTVYERLVAKGGKQVLIGVSPALFASAVGNMTGMLPRRATIASGIGGIQATQEIIDLFAKNKIYPRVEIRPVEDLNKIMMLLDKGNDDSIRYVLDIETLNEKAIEKCTDAPVTMAHPPHQMSAMQVVAKYFGMLIWGRRD